MALTNPVNANTQGLQSVNVTNGNWIGRSITSTDGSITITNADGTTGNPNLSVNAAGIAYYSLTPYIVGADVHSQYTTIASAIAAASGAGGGNVYIKPGTYTENLTLQPNVNLIGFGDSVTIVGKTTYTGIGTVFITGVILQTNSDFLLSVTGNSASVVRLNYCFLNATNNNAIQHTSSSASSIIWFDNCQGTLGLNTLTWFVSTATGTIVFSNCNLRNEIASNIQSSVSIATIQIRNSYMPIPLLTSSTGGYIIENCDISTDVSSAVNLTVRGTGICSLFNCSLGAGNNPCIDIGSGTTVNCYSCQLKSTNTNAIAGSGTLNYGDLTFISSSKQFQNTLTVALAGATPSNATSGFVWTSTGVNTTPTWQASSGGFIWSDVTGSTQTIVAGNGYLADRGGGVAFTLPASATIGDAFRIVGVQGSWTLAQAAGQQIKFGSTATTVGITGSLASTNAGDCIECVATNTSASTIWRVMSSVGNITVA